MQHAVHSLERALHGRLVAQVADDQLGGRAQVLGRLARGVGEGVEVVEHPDLLAALEQRVDEVGADEPGPSRDQHRAHQIVPSSSSEASAWTASAASTAGSAREGSSRAAARQAKGTRKR